MKRLAITNDSFRRVRVSVVAALLAGTASHAAAQQQTGTPAPTAAADVAGVAAQESAVFSLTTRYDSNVRGIDQSAPGVPIIPGVARNDVRITPSLQVAYSRNIGRHLVGLNAGLGYDFYIDSTRVSRERISVSPFANLDLPVCDLAVLGAVSRRQSDIAELTFVTVNPALGIDNAETQYRANGRLICGGAYGIRPTFEVDYNEGSNSNVLRQRANYNSTRLQSGLSYASPTLGDISVYATRTKTELPNQLTSVGGPAGFLVRGAGVSYRRAIGTRLVFNGALSYVDLQPDSPVLPSQSGINSAVSFSLTASTRLQFVGSYSRAFTSSLSSNASYEIANNYALNATYAVNDRLRLRTGASISPKTLFYDIAPIGPFITRQRVSNIYAGASYSLNNRIRLSLDGGYQSRSAELAAFDYDSFFVAANVSVTL